MDEPFLSLHGGLRGSGINWMTYKQHIFMSSELRKMKALATFLAGFCLLSDRKGLLCPHMVKEMYQCLVASYKTFFWTMKVQASTSAPQLSNFNVLIWGGRFRLQQSQNYILNQNGKVKEEHWMHPILLKKNVWTCLYREKQEKIKEARIVLKLVRQRDATAISESYLRTTR